MSHLVLIMTKWNVIVYIEGQELNSSLLSCALEILGLSRRLQEENQLKQQQRARNLVSQPLGGFLLLCITTAHAQWPLRGKMMSLPLYDVGLISHTQCCSRLREKLVFVVIGWGFLLGIITTHARAVVTRGKMMSSPLYDPHTLQDQYSTFSQPWTLTPRKVYKQWSPRDKVTSPLLYFIPMTWKHGRWSTTSW